jgi:hypothetical protein
VVHEDARCDGADEASLAPHSRTRYAAQRSPPGRNLVGRARLRGPRPRRRSSRGAAVALMTPQTDAHAPPRRGHRARSPPLRWCSRRSAGGVTARRPGRRSGHPRLQATPRRVVHDASSSLVSTSRIADAGVTTSGPAASRADATPPEGSQHRPCAHAIAQQGRRLIQGEPRRGWRSETTSSTDRSASCIVLQILDVALESYRLAISPSPDSAWASSAPQRRLHSGHFGALKARPLRPSLRATAALLTPPGASLEVCGMSWLAIRIRSLSPASDHTDGGRLPWGLVPYDAYRSRQRPTPGLPHPAVLRLQVFSTS